MTQDKLPYVQLVLVLQAYAQVSTTFGIWK
jgi:hypothetical protein